MRPPGTVTVSILSAHAKVVPSVSVTVSAATGAAGATSTTRAVYPAYSPLATGSVENVAAIPDSTEAVKRDVSGTVAPGAK